MKRILFILLILFAVAFPALAQEAVEAAPTLPLGLPESSLNAVIVGISAIAIISLVLYANHKKLTVKQAFQSLGPLVTDYGYPMAWRYRYDLAQKTVDPSDNEALKQEARMFGYKLTEQPDGSMLIERDLTPPNLPPAP